jgi:hypothetical protein
VVRVDIALVLSLPPSERISSMDNLALVLDAIVVTTRCSVAALGKVLFSVLFLVSIWTCYAVREQRVPASKLP